MKKIIISLFDDSVNWAKPYKDNGFEVRQVDTNDIMAWNYQTEFCKGVSKNDNGLDLQKNCFVVGVLASIPDKDSSSKSPLKALEIIRYFGNTHWGYHGGKYAKGETEFFWCIESPQTSIHNLVPDEVGALKVKIMADEFKTHPTWLFGEFQAPEKKAITHNGFSKAFYQFNH